MPEIIKNEDGTTTFSINSGELRALKTMLDEHVPDAKKLLQVVDGPELRMALSFVRSIVD